MNTLNTKKISLRRLVYSAVCLALCLLLPFLTGQIPQVGKALSPMHIPVLLGGFLCGPWWAALVGLIAPVLRSLLFSSPALFPMATAMSFELAAYGLGAGLLYRLLHRRCLRRLGGGHAHWPRVLWHCHVSAAGRQLHLGGLRFRRLRHRSSRYYSASAPDPAHRPGPAKSRKAVIASRQSV